MAGNKSKLTMKNPGSEDEIAQAVDGIDNNTDVDEVNVAASTDQKNAAQAKKEIGNVVKLAGDREQQFDTEPTLLANEDNDVIDTNENNHSTKLADNLLNSFSMTESGSIGSDFRRDLSGLEAENTRTTKVLREAISKLESRKTGIDLTPLLALFDDPDQDTASMAKLLSTNKFTERDKEQSLLDMKLKLATHQDQFDSNIRKSLSEHDKKQRDFLVKLADKQHGLDENLRDNLRAGLKDYDKSEQVKKANVLIGNSRGLIEALEDPGSYNADGTLKSAIAQDIKFKRARILNGAGVLTNQDFKQAGGSPELVNSVQRGLNLFESGEPLTKRDLEEFIQSAKISANIGSGVARAKAKEFVRDAPDTIGISSKKAQDIMDRRIRTLEGDTLYKVSKIPKALEKSKGEAEKKSIAKSTEAITGDLKNIGSQVVSGAVKGLVKGTFLESLIGDDDPNVAAAKGNPRAAAEDKRQKLLKEQEQLKGVK